MEAAEVKVDTAVVGTVVDAVAVDNVTEIVGAN